MVVLKMGKMVIGLGLLLLSPICFANGASLYLPLNLSPQIERQIDRFLVISEIAVIKRPISINTVKYAVNKHCDRAAELCNKIKVYITRYEQEAGFIHADLSGNLSKGDKTVPNQRGLNINENYQASVQAFWQPTSYAIINAGGMLWEDNHSFEGSYISLGQDYAQLDIGYKPHWLSPFSNAAMLQSTQAETYATVSISNQIPLTSFGFGYEFYWGQLSYSDRISHEGAYTSGKPYIAGMQLSIEPFKGISLGINRLMQYGGGKRGGSSLKDISNAFFDPSSFDNTNENLNSDQEFGNQLASIVSRINFDSETPFALYFEYAGEDTNRGTSWRLGNAALQVGLDIPLIWDDFDFVYEWSEFQNSWYVHHIYSDGLSENGHVLGHWAGDERQKGNAVGAQSHTFNFGWQINENQQLRIRYSTLKNEQYSQVKYQVARDVMASYSYNYSTYIVGTNLYFGRDVFNEKFASIAAFIQW